MLRFLKKHGKKFVRAGLLIAIVVAASTMMTSSVPAAEDNTNKLISVGISAGDGSDMASVLQMLLVLTVIALAPSILIMLTSFTRIVIVLHFTRTALGTQTIPPNQIIVGLSLFLTLFVMSPTFNEVYQSAVVPLSNNEISMQVSQVENMITGGCDVIVIASIDGSSLTEALKGAKEKNIPVIAYDRLIMNSDAVKYYATFDNYLVGKTQGEYIRDALDLENKDGPFNIELFTGSADDNNVNFFFGGAMDVLKPYIDSGKLVVPSKQTTKDQLSIRIHNAKDHCLL